VPVVTSASFPIAISKQSGYSVSQLQKVRFFRSTPQLLMKNWIIFGAKKSCVVFGVRSCREIFPQVILGE
jgi:hypothetical protein